MEKGTISVCFVHQALQGAVEHGHDPAVLLRRAGMPPGILAHPSARVGTSVYAALLREIAQLLDDELFGQDSRRMKVGSFALLCRGVVHAPTLGKALDRMCRSFGLFIDDVLPTVSRDAEAERGPRLARLALLPTDPERPPRLFLQETLLTFMHGLACWLVRRRIPVVRADFAYPRPPHAGEYHLLYASRLHFDQTQTALWLDAAHLDLPTVQDERTVKDFLRAAPENMLTKYKNVTGVASRIRRLLRQTPPPDWPTFEALADRLGTAPTTLRRHLRQDGQSYRSIKDQLRRDLAMIWLAEQGRGVTEVAADLGYLEPSAFHRAFRKWTGARPGDYRRRR